MTNRDTFSDGNNVQLRAAGGAVHHHGLAHHRSGGVAFGQADFRV